MVAKRNMCAMLPLCKCTRGARCGFAHSLEEIGDMVQDPQELKLEMCRYWKSSTANYCAMSSEECPFAHGAHEIGSKRFKGGKVGKKGKGGKGKGKASGKESNSQRNCARRDDSRSKNRHAQRDDARSPSKKQHKGITLVGRSNMRGSHARRDDSRSPPVLPIIIQTCSLVEDMAPVIPL